MRNALRTRNEKNAPQEKSATSEEVARVKKLFDDKGWPLESGEFDDFCTMVANLETEVQKNLILELSQRFYWVTANEYYGLFENAFEQMIASKTANIIRKLTIVIIPLMTNDNSNEIKSGCFLFYLIKSGLSKLQKKYKGKCSITCIESFEKTLLLLDADRLCNDPDTFVCPVDDYLGSGTTVLECLYNLKSWGLPDSKILFLILVAQKQGLENCSSANVFSSVQLKKQLSDYPDAKGKIEIMNEIEKSIHVSEKYHLGYQGTEALVKLVHTPNNTFPVYWFSYKGRRTVPFPR